MAREKIRRLPQLTPEEMRHYQQVVKELAEEGVPQERLRQEYREYAPDKPLGRAICESYPLETLTDILSERAEELGRAPVQWEIFPLYRAYLKRRFGTWPAALRAAGLRPGLETQPVEEDWTAILKETPEVGRALLRVAEQWMTCGVPPLRREVQQAKLLRARFGEWSAVLSAAKSLDSWLEAHPTPLAPPGAGGSGGAPPAGGGAGPDAAPGRSPGGAQAGAPNGLGKLGQRFGSGRPAAAGRGIQPQGGMGAPAESPRRKLHAPPGAGAHCGADGSAE